MVTINLKDGVSLAGLTEEMAEAIFVIALVHSNLGYKFTITSCADGKHMEGSKHYCGDALDSRTRDIPTWAKKEELRDSLANSLGPDFDVVLESDHMHIERDPK